MTNFYTLESSILDRRLTNYGEIHNVFLHGTAGARPWVHPDMPGERGGIYVTKTLTQAIRGTIWRSNSTQNPTIFVYSIRQMTDFASQYDPTEDEAVIKERYKDDYIGKLSLKTGAKEVNPNHRDFMETPEILETLREEIRDKVPRFCKDAGDKDSFAPPVHIEKKDLAALAELPWMRPSQ